MLDPRKSTAELLVDIRNRVMSMDGTDTREEVADLRRLVASQDARIALLEKFITDHDRRLRSLGPA